VVSDDSVNTLTLEFKLYCDDAWKKSLLGTFLFLGSIIGTAIFGFISNNYGRKKACVCAYVLGSIGALLIAASPNYYVALLFFTICGLVLPYNNFCSIVLNEIGDGNFRNFATGMILVA